jgi:hypothetical protein
MKSTAWAVTLGIIVCSRSKCIDNIKEYLTIQLACSTLSRNPPTESVATQLTASLIETRLKIIITLTLCFATGIVAIVMGIATRNDNTFSQDLQRSINSESRSTSVALRHTSSKSWRTAQYQDRQDCQNNKTEIHIMHIRTVFESTHYTV